MPPKVNKAPSGPTQSITHNLHLRTCWEGTEAPTSRDTTALAAGGENDGGLGPRLQTRLRGILR